MFQMLIRPNVEFNVYLIYENDESISPEVSFLMSFENLFFQFREWTLIKKNKFFQGWSASASQSLFESRIVKTFLEFFSSIFMKDSHIASQNRIEYSSPYYKRRFHSIGGILNGLK